MSSVSSHALQNTTRLFLLFNGSGLLLHRPQVDKRFVPYTSAITVDHVTRRVPLSRNPQRMTNSGPVRRCRNNPDRFVFCNRRLFFVADC